MESSTVQIFTDTTEAPPSQPDAFYATFLPLFCVVTCLANLATIVAFSREPNLRERPSEVFILSLSCADFGTGLLALPANSLSYIFPQNWPLGEAGCLVEVFFFDLTVHASLMTLLSISIDRFLLVYLEYPRYLKMQSYHRVHVTMLMCWTVAILTGILEMALWNIAKTQDETAALIDFSMQCLSPPRRLQAYALALITVLYFIPIIAMCALSVAFLYLLRKRLIKTRVSKFPTLQGPSQITEMQSVYTLTSDQPCQQPQNIPPRQVQERNRYIRPAVTLIALISAMTLCMLPYCMYVIVVDGICLSCTYDKDLFNILLFLQYSNALLDPFLYALTQRKIRRYYKSCLYSVKSRFSSATFV